jgi:hypothetical protein
VVDVGSGHEIAGDGFGKFCAETIGFCELGFSAGVEEAEARVAGMAKHAAATAVSKGKLAEGRFGLRGSGAGRSGGGHDWLLGEECQVGSNK